ncbi:MAG: four helix bundle protein, partial [Rubricoccaceae bacterium]|nr:four helix bundle protein [Rubricoccaceae bacterium]
TNFESLDVYQRAEELADLVWDVVTGWERFARDTVGKQLVRAADSVPANIAEGSGRSSPRDRKHFVRIARGSLYETKNGLRRAYRRNLLAEDQIETLKPLTDALAPMLNAYLRSIGESAKELNTKSKEPHGTSI